MLFEYKNTTTFLFIFELRTKKHVDFKLCVHGESALACVWKIYKNMTSTENDREKEK